MGTRPPPRVPPVCIAAPKPPPPPTDTIVRLVVAYLHREAATQDRCSAHLSIFPWAPYRRPKQGDQMQRARARTPAASIRLMGSRGGAIWIHGGCSHGEGGRSRWEVHSVTAAHFVSGAFFVLSFVLHTCLVLSIWGTVCPLIPEKCYTKDTVYDVRKIQRS
jgi:hypothetical protein